jgi:probable rRNA maturation factor
VKSRKGVGETDSRPKSPIRIELSVESGDWPAERKLRELASMAIDAACAELGWRDGQKGEVSLLFADDDRIAELNAAWRGKDGPTNVLSFPAGFETDVSGKPLVLGDIAFAFQTVAREADIESKPFDHHLTHLIVHGFLHLCGYDHLDDEEAEAMEDLEIGALARLDIPDPYAVTQSLQD